MRLATVVVHVARVMMLVRGRRRLVMGVFVAVTVVRRGRGGMVVLLLLVVVSMRRGGGVLVAAGRRRFVTTIVITWRGLRLCCWCFLRLRGRLNPIQGGAPTSTNQPAVKLGTGFATNCPKLAMLAFDTGSWTPLRNVTETDVNASEE